MSKRKKLLFILLGLFSLCILASGISALSNKNILKTPEVTDNISQLDKDRLAETLHLKDDLGEKVWPGWGQLEIPILLWNEEYSFLVGYPNHPEGWGEVKGDVFNNEPYYRQNTKDQQNFAVLVDGQWVASLATKSEMDHFIISQFMEMIPSPINQIIPYRLFIQPTEVHISGVLHETFHVYQTLIAPDKLALAEDRYDFDANYWEIDENMRDEWKAEINLLAQALEAEIDAEASELVTQFLEEREQRREKHDLDDDMINFERLIEWEEGLAKYVEVAIWKQAFSSPNYESLAEMSDDPDFNDYKTFEKRWNQEIMTMKNQASQEGDTRFYYTGMAQGFLLDRLLPDWKTRIMAENVWLEELLLEAIGNN
jgi:ABC-type Fe3+-hydroxamate transport system substrate-binding protein